MPNFNGTAGDDIFTGGADADIIVGNGGNDQLTGGGGNDSMEGNAGADTLNGGDGDDYLFSYDRDPNFGGFLGRGISSDIFAEVDTLVGGAGDDYIFAGVGDHVDGGAVGSYGNRLYISFMGATSGVQADFRPLQSQSSIVIAGATISNIQNIGYLEGSNFDDFLVPIDTYYPTGANVYGRGGNDHLLAGYYSGWGSSGLYGGDGDDIVDARGSQYSANVYGDGGNDTLYTSSNGFGVAYGGDGNDTIYSHGTTYGGAGNDIITMQQTYYGGLVYGEAGDDQIQASMGGNSISGGAGADNLLGSNAVDTLASGDFVANSATPADDLGLEHDTLAGFGGNDIISVGYGDDADGGGGTDRLYYSLGGATGGVTFSTAGMLGGTPFVFAGGTISNFETLEYLRGGEFADTLYLATQGSLLTVNGRGGDDHFTSNGSSVSVLGGEGDDRLVSGIAGDLFDGGNGTDTVDYQFYASAVTVSLGLAAGSSGSGAGGDQLINVENVDGSASGDTIAGSDQANVLRGNGGNDTLRGHGGNDLLIGDAGADQLEGGAGNDAFLVDGDDLVTEAAGGGYDTVYTTAGYALATGSHIEVLTVYDRDTANAISLAGNGYANTIYGNQGSNFLNGNGGSDTLYGLGGDDRYLVDSFDDLVIEFAGGGYDTVYAAASHSLAAGAEVEVLTVYDRDTVNAVNLTGNGFANAIYGNNGSNTLIGNGGADTFYGLAGDDRYLVEGLSDQVFEAAGGGYDTVYSFGSFALNNASFVEALSVYDRDTTNALTLFGNELANVIYGNNGSNALLGGGGTDTLYGMGGDDRFVIDSADDVVIEFSGGGNDTLYTTVGYTLAATDAEIEVLTVYDRDTGNALNLTGNGIANTIYGNAGTNVIDGKGGSDLLFGMGGADSFAFTSALGAGNVDSIFGFVGGAGGDRILLDDAVFAGLAPGTLPASAFVTGSAAADADDRIVYNQATGQLFFDADGNGAGAAILFATLEGAPVLTASDFTIL